MSKKQKNPFSRHFLLLLAGQTISQMGSSMTGFAVIIWAYSSTGQVMASSLLAVCSAVPYLIVSLFGGAAADRMNKKRIMLLCDTIAAAGSLVLLLCVSCNVLQLWILCAVNILSGFMNAFQGPASQVAVTLLVEEKDYARAGGLQSALGAVCGMLNPILAAALLGFGGLRLVLAVDLATFLFAFLVLLLFIRIPDTVSEGERVSLRELGRSMKEGIGFLRGQKSILLLLVMFSVLEFLGAISFDSMYSPLLLARTGNDEAVVGIVSSVAAAGGLGASLLMSVAKPPARKLRVMFAGAVMCLTGILLFGMGRSLLWWCVVVFLGCFGSPVYQTYQTVILRERVPVAMQGRIFSLQGMITQSLTPLGCLAGAALADWVFEPFMQRTGAWQTLFGRLVGTGSGAGMGLMFVFAGACGILLCLLFGASSNLRELERDNAGEAMQSR
ncbi:MAG TPA: MFS transporter [Candidatus Eisenbergiella merdavium]|uniref:MFS transporter n=1 Tax=Candidatus Eisenbergiella merdavium TaxID=2838551 RepID=A0A9D2SQJ4_9FIRM|nr:MFS transporter [Candidatus Eisenbergiella merdavium]